jgi:hypothetical protein
VFFDNRFKLHDFEEFSSRLDLRVPEEAEMAQDGKNSLQENSGLRFGKFLHGDVEKDHVGPRSRSLWSIFMGFVLMGKIYSLDME